jgi:hypothetical protein
MASFFLLLCFFAFLCSIHSALDGTIDCFVACFASAKIQSLLSTFSALLFIFFWTLLFSHRDNLLKVRYGLVQYGQRMRLSLTPSLSDEWSRRDEPAQKKLKAPARRAI